jgi:hypothetical protein
MMEYLDTQFRALRPAFTRRATFVWFVVAFAGVVTRNDLYGVSSTVRALSLAPVFYPALLHFFHSNAWTAESLYRHWEQWLMTRPVIEPTAPSARRTPSSVGSCPPPTARPQRGDRTPGSPRGVARTGTPLACDGTGRSRSA